MPSSPTNIKGFPTQQFLPSPVPSVAVFGSKVQCRGVQYCPVLQSITKDCSAAGGRGEPHNTSKLQLLQMNVCVSFRHPHECLAFENAESIWSWHSYFVGILQKDVNSNNMKYTGRFGWRFFNIFKINLINIFQVF